MPTAVVLGPHRSGTSLVASMLYAMGVDMGAVLMGEHISQPRGHWEDFDFVRMDNEILAGHGGTWDNPPDVDWRQFRPELAMLVTLKKHPEMNGGEPRAEGDWWGWKDPRTCLTAACYHQYLNKPHYIAVDRNREAIVKSLEWREGKAGDRWARLTDLYLDRREWFLDNVDAPILRMRYEEIVNPDKALRQCLKLARFLGLKMVEAQAARRRIDVREPGQNHDNHTIVLGDVELKQGHRVIDATKWERGWDQIHGPVESVFIGKDAPADEAKGWMAKVRPGGVVTVTGKVAHDWPETAWSNRPSFHTRRPFLQRGDPFGTLGIGVPYHKPEYDFWRWFSWVLLQGLEPGDLFLNDDSVRAPLPIPVVHNRLIARFLESDRDTLCIVEDDHVANPDIIRRMREKRENWDYDIVCANYVNRREFPSLTGYGLGGKTGAGEILCVLNWDDTAKSGTEPVDGAAMGLVLIRRWVLDAMLGGGNPKETWWCEWVGGNSQDIVFYYKAKALGARAAVDRDANIGHIARTVRTVDDFWEMREGSRGA